MSTRIFVVMILVLCPLIGWARGHHPTHHHLSHTSHHTTRLATNSTLTCLTSAIYHEARGESVSTQINVARVVLNRTAADGFKSTACGVIAQIDYKYPHHRGKIIQFPWYYHSHHDKIDIDAYHASMDAAKQALALHQQYGPTSSLYFNSSPKGFDHHHYMLTQHQGHMSFYQARQLKHVHRFG